MDRHIQISIHAPRAGSDLGSKNFYDMAEISIHAPRAGSDSWMYLAFATYRRFQSTLPVRGATKKHCGAIIRVIISIHAPRAGSDPDTMPVPPVLGRFQSTLPVRGATRNSGIFFLQLGYFNPRSPCGERRQNQTKYGLYFGKIAEVSDRQQQRFGMYEVKHERLERLQGHFEKFRGANGRRIF